jgi:hypothetical protein
MPHWIDVHGDVEKIGLPKEGRDVDVANWPKDVLTRSRADTKWAMRVAHRLESDADRYDGSENPIDT